MNLLLIEDSPDDVAAVRRIANALPAVQMTVIDDGDRAAAELNSWRAPEPPHLILLDIQLPGVPGTRLLRQIKASAVLRDVPIVMLTGSDRDEDVREAQDLGAHSYLVKPLKARDFAWMARAAAAYRAALSRIPAETPSLKEGPP